MNNRIDGLRQKKIKFWINNLYCVLAIRILYMQGSSTNLYAFPVFDRQKFIRRKRFQSFSFTLSVLNNDNIP